MKFGNHKIDPGLKMDWNEPERRSASSNATVSAFRFVETDYMS